MKDVSRFWVAIVSRSGLYRGGMTVTEWRTQGPDIDLVLVVEAASFSMGARCVARTTCDGADLATQGVSVNGDDIEHPRNPGGLDLVLVLEATPFSVVVEKEKRSEDGVVG